MANSDVRVTTPEILWHGGGLLPGKPDPVLSIDMYQEDILATAGIDANIPPKGSIRLWKFGSIDSELQFLVDFSDHQDVVNAVRFSPCGKMIASASLVPDPRMWRTIDDPKVAERIWLRPCLQEIYDLNWSPDSQFLIAGSIDSKAEILRVKDRNALGLRGHTSYVQGVAWDPMNQMVVTQSADRSCRVHLLKHRDGSMVKLAPKGHSVIKMFGSQPSIASTDGVESKCDTPSTPPRSEAETSGRMSPTNQSVGGIVKGVNLFADSSVATCFFRRLAFSPDGSLLVTPTGVFKSHMASSHSSSSNFATHIFHRGDLSSPIVSLVGLESPSVAVRFSPLLYQMIPSQCPPLLHGDYRMVFAVVTTTAVVIYDTQHFYPLARIDGCHLATINDIAWSSNGQTLVFCSSDGYVTFARFNSDVLGVPIPLEKVPSEVKNAFSSVYLPPQIDLPLPPTTPSSFQPMKEEQGCPMKEGLKRSREENCSEVAPTALSSSATAAAPAPADSTGDAAKSKKKRITPVLSQSPISPCSLFGKEGDQLSGLIPIDLTSGDSNPGLPSKTEEAPSLQLNVRSESGKKVKKRITPVAGPLPVPPIGDAVSPPQPEP